MSTVMLKPQLEPESRDRLRLLSVEHPDPHSVLGAHPCPNDPEGVVVRSYHPRAIAVECLLADGEEHPLEPLGDGLFALYLPETKLPLRYRLRFTLPEGEPQEADDPYRFPPTLGDLDAHLIGEGRHERLWDIMGAHLIEHEGAVGVRFAVCSSPGAGGSGSRLAFMAPSSASLTSIS
mgnify:CR=1 FL=1